MKMTILQKQYKALLIELNKLAYAYGYSIHDESIRSKFHQQRKIVKFFKQIYRENK